MFKNFFKLISVVFLLAVFSQNGFAQASGYGFTQTAGTYTAITGGTVLWSGTFDENISAAITIPTFIYDGVARTSLYVTANGFITFGLAPTGTNYSPISSTATYSGAISAFGRDLNNGASGTPEIRYEQVGNEFVIQWQDVRRYNLTEIISFQVRLNTLDNTIRIVYGGTITPGSSSTYPQVGLRGTTNTDFKNRSILTGGGSWINSVAGATNAATMFFNSSDVTTVPSSGLTFTFSPPSIFNPTGVSATAMSTSQINVAFTPNGTNPVIMVFNTTGTFTAPAGTPPAVGQPFAGGTLIYNGLTSPYMHTGRAAGTTYFYKLFTWDGASAYTSGVAVNATTWCDPITSFPVPESFDGTTFPPTCWTNAQVSLTGLWDRQTAGTFPTCTPHSGAAMTRFNCYNLSTGTSSILVTAPVTFPNDGYQVTFWMYRDGGYPTNADKVDIHFNTSPSLTGATLLGTINRSMSLTPIVGAEGWYEYSFPLPTGFSGNGFFVFQGTSAFGNNIFVDDVTIKVKATGTLNGTITNCFTPFPNIEGATVTAGTYSTTTNASGFYQFTGILVGTYDVTASKPGYANATITGVVVTDGGTTTQSFCMDENLYPPVNLGASVAGQNVSLTWMAPDADRWLRWDDGVNFDAIGIGGGTFAVSARFPQSITGSVIGKELTQVEIYINDPVTACTLKVYGQGTSSSPGTLLYQEDITSQIVSFSWNLINLTTPVAITGYDIWVGYEVTTPDLVDAFPAGCDNGPAAANGDWVTLDGITWDRLSVLVPALNYNWNIAGYVEDPLLKGEERVKLALNPEDVARDREARLFEVNNTNTLKIESGTGIFKAVHFNTQSVSQFINYVNNNQIQKNGGNYSPDATLTGYTVYRNGSPLTTTSNLFYNDNSVPYGIYNYTVSAQYSEGESDPAGPVVAAIVPPAASLPLTQNFDAGLNNWLVVNGTQTNQWHVGIAAGPVSSPNSIYISSDGGTTFGYDEDATSVVHFFRDVAFTGAVGGGYKLTFQWKCVGEPVTYDYFKVYLVDTGVLPVEGIELTSGQIGQVRYNDQANYVEASIILPEALTGTTKRLVFSWKDDFCCTSGAPASIDDISIEIAPPGTYPPNDLQASVSGQDVMLTWLAPDADRWLRYDDGVNSGNAIGLGGATFQASARFPASITGSVVGKDLTDVDIFIYMDVTPPTNVTIKIYDEGTPTSPGTVLHSEDVTAQIIVNTWNTITLNSPVAITGDDIWIGYEVTGGDFPAGVDDGPAAPDGDWVSTDGLIWEHLIDFDLDFNWNIAGYVTDGIPLVRNTANSVDRETVELNRNDSKVKKTETSNGSFSLINFGVISKSSYINNNLAGQQHNGNRDIDATFEGYNVYRNSVEIAHSITNEFYSDLSLPLGVYSYTVTALYTEGESDAEGPVEVVVAVDVYPMSATYWTGNTEGTVKTDGEINTVFPNYGWAVFDISGIPSDATITNVVFNGYVKANSWPYWGITPMGIVDPVADDAPTIFAQIDGVLLADFYSYSTEGGTLPLGWLSRELVGTAAADMETALAQGYFAIGFVDTDGIPDFYINFDGWSDANPPYLQIIYEVGGTTFAFSVPVTNGWNMVSAPGLNTPDQNVSTWWPNLTGTVWGFNGTIYQARTVTTPGEGYWMKNVGSETYSYTGIEIVTHDAIAATAGWNMIGGYETSVATSGLTTVPSGQQTGTIWGFNGTVYTAATTFEPGKGYWVKTLSACDIVIPEALSKGSGEVVDLFKEDWGRIILTDAAGKSYTLYAVKGEVDLDQYEMPPAVPGGMFDIRFSSGRIAEDINSSMQSIDMIGITYPLTVRVEGMDIRMQDMSGRAINQNLKSGEEVVINDATIQKLMVTGELIPTVYALEQNYPNPFNPSTVIEFSLPEDVSNVKLSIYNALGEKVAEIVNSSLAAGRYSYQWNAKNVATGMYIYELRTDKFVSVKKMLLLK